MNGIINVKKEKGFTSHDVVAKLRGILHFKKIGHTGTLDPDATGVLPVCIGKATKVVDLLTEKDKTYIAGVKLGVKTDTLDMTGTVLETRPVTCTGEDLEQCLKSFEGDIEQVPPMYSAIKIQGKRLYEMARQGKTVERKPRKVTIYSLKLLQADLEKNWFEIEVHCSKGTYIRSLCDDIGEKLGCLAAMNSLVRTQVVLPVCIGKATKVVDLLTEKDKTYIAGVKLGVKTDTLDMTGTVLETRPVTCTGEDLEQCLKSFEGDIEQVPPMYSAIKIQGKRLYEMARQGKTVERKPRKVTIYSLKLLQADLEKNWFEIEVHCSKGTYIRSLCDDIGEKLGCLAAMNSLVRTQVGRFSLDEAYTLDEIEQKVKEDRLDEVLLSIDSLFMEYPAVQVLETGMKYLQNGNEIPVNSCQDGDKIAFRKTVRMYDTNREFYALYQRNAATNKFSIVKMFHP